MNIFIILKHILPITHREFIDISQLIPTLKQYSELCSLSLSIEFAHISKQRNNTYFQNIIFPTNSIKNNSIVFTTNIISYFNPQYQKYIHLIFAKQPKCKFIITFKNKEICSRKTIIFISKDTISSINICICLSYIQLTPNHK